jgi:3-oxoacyl-(acyl-carrier-protein) synthase
MTTSNGRRRVVVTGMGTLNPLGNSVEEFWRNALAAQSGVDWLTQVDSTGYDIHIAGEVKNFTPEDYMDRKEARRMARFSQLAIAAAREASRLGLDIRGPYRVGVMFGNGMGGYPDTDRAVKDIVQKGARRMDPFYMVKMLPNMAAAQVAMQYGAKGYNATISTACASAGNAMGEALEMIRTGRADVMITGGTEAGLSELGLAAFQVMKALSTNNDPPSGASRRSMRSATASCRRGAACHHRSARAREEAWRRSSPSWRATAVLRRAPRRRAGRGRRDDGRVHDAGAARRGRQPCGHRLHQRARDVNAGERQVRDHRDQARVRRAGVPAPDELHQVAHRHTLGASAAIEAIACVQSILTGWMHPTINQEYPDPDCDLDYVPNVARNVGDVSVVLKNSFGFGGQNACLVFKKFVE